jgi:hypothetical protein
MMPATRTNKTSEAASTGPLVPPRELEEPIAQRRRAGQDRLVAQVALHIAGEVLGGLVAAVTVLLQALHHDPVELAAHQLGQFGRLHVALGRDRCQSLARIAQPRARPRWLLLLDQAENLAKGCFLEPLAGERRAPRQQFVEQHPQREDVAAGIGAQGAHLRLLGRHVLKRADHGAVLREQGPLGQLLLGRLGHAEVDHLRHRLAVVEGDHDVGRLDVAVNDPFLVGVLDRLADRHEQLQPLARRQAVVVAVLGDGHAVDQLHDEIRPAGFGGPGIEDAGDVDVVHHSQGLALGLEPGDDLLGVHAGLDHLEGNLAADRVSLLGHEDRAHAALADLLEELVRADDRAGAFGDGRLIDRCDHSLTLALFS